MKKICFLFFVLFLSTGAFAQQKYGHINSGDILDAMPEYKQMTATLDNKRKQYAYQLQRMYEEYQKKGKELNDYGASMMQAVREERMIELDSLQQAITGFEGSAQGEVEKLQGKLMKPLNDKYLKVVDAVAKENGYTYIFDLATGVVAYYPENSGDVTELVKKKMGIN
ncbi:MAG TPA: OmpH family outer membrane protein [Chitinophagales bacterium]|nr:OmpH family outer membrane protein [Chitinophagales bacterium]HLP53195.1 OmpH family outer membrane protein [Chitinophagales bacterium]